MQENEQKRPSYTYCSSPQMWHIFQKQQQGEQIPIFLPPNFYNQKIPSWFYVLTSTLEAQKAEHQRELLQHVLQITFWTAQNPLRQNCAEGYKTHKSSKFEVATGFWHGPFYPCHPNWWWKWQLTDFSKKMPESGHFLTTTLRLVVLSLHKWWKSRLSRA